MEFHITSKIADIRGHIYRTLGDNINVVVSIFCLLIPIFIPDPDTRVIFDESIKKNFTSSVDSWTTDAKTANTRKAVHVGVGSATTIDSPDYIPVAHQTVIRKSAANKKNHQQCKFFCP